MFSSAPFQMECEQRVLPRSLYFLKQRIHFLCECPVSLLLYEPVRWPSYPMPVLSIKSCVWVPVQKACVGSGSRGLK